jgi:hypothetical protein
MAKQLTSSKAREILHDKSVHGHPLTDKQRRFFGAIAGGAKPYKAEEGGWLDAYEQGGLILKKKTKDNFGKKANPNDVEAKTGPGYVGLAYDITGRNYSPAWGGSFAAMGANVPTLKGATGMIYARTINPAPANGKYTKKTQASAQNGMEMKFYQQGLDFKPKTISQNGSVIDPRGQWAYPGEITTIPSNEITMEGVDYDVVGISNTGDKKLMKPGKNYKFKGDYVTEYPKGGWLDKYK